MGHHGDNTRTPPGHHCDIIGTPPGHHQDTTETLSGHCQDTLEQHQEAAGTPPDHHQATTRTPPGHWTPQNRREVMHRVRIDSHIDRFVSICISSHRNRLDSHRFQIDNIASTRIGFAPIFRRSHPFGIRNLYLRFSLVSGVLCWVNEDL